MFIAAHPAGQHGKGPNEEWQALLQGHDQAATDLVEVARAAADSAAEALGRTTGQLSALRNAGVVDAGGRGLLILLDALVEVLTGEAPERPDYGVASVPADAACGAGAFAASAAGAGARSGAALFAPAAAVAGAAASLSRRRCCGRSIPRAWKAWRGSPNARTC